MEILDVYNAKIVGSVWTEIASNKQPYLGSGTLFPMVKQDILDLAFIKGHKGLPTSLKASTYDAKAEFRDRIGIAKLETEIPYFKEGFILKASDIVKIHNAQNQNDAYMREALRRIFRDGEELIDGAYVVPERMIFQLLAPTNGKPVITMGDEKSTYTFNYDPDGEWEKNNYLELTGTSAWTDFENSTPYDDMERALDKASENGTVITNATMNKVTLSLLVKNKDIHARILAQNPTANIYLTKSLVKSFLETNLGITIVLYDKLYKDEEGKTKKFMPDNMVSFIPSVTLGEVRFGPTPEELEQQADMLNLVDGRIALSVVKGTGNPVSVETIASMSVLPSFEAMDMCYAMKVA